MAEFINPFDFRKIIINLFLGNIEIFMFAFVFIFSFASAKYGMSNRIFMVLLAIGALIFGGVMDAGIYTLVVLIVGMVTYKSISRVVA